MKKQILMAAALFVLVVGCNKATNNTEATETDVVATERKCAANDVLEEQMNADPALRQRMNDIEEFTKRVIANPSQYRLVGNIIEIPVVVNILYKTNAQNISLAQIESQIDVLNKDFSATNSDYNNPNTYQSVRSGDIGVRFVIDNTTTDIVRKKSNKTSWQLNDGMKKSNQGGIDPTSPTTKLNIWVCNLASGYLGYAQFPGGNAATDGVVIDENAFGTIGTASAPFNKGRTATHEVGHWMNLRHIWGDATCGNDGVGDTPLHNTANYGCPSSTHRSTCTGTPLEMTMNYMDYMDDACM
ncbi:MAG TPA: zinc metalloprotease, partial [Chitinophagaceae bacterium]